MKKKKPKHLYQNSNLALLANHNGYFSNFQICKFANMRVCLSFWGRGGTSVTRAKTRVFFQKSNLALLATLNGYFFGVGGWVVRNSYGGYSETPQTHSFRLFALLTSSPGVQWRYLGGEKVSLTHHYGNMFYFQMPQHIHFFRGSETGSK